MEHKTQECMFVLTKGKNKGKKCYEVNKYCHNQTHTKFIKHQPLLQASPNFSKISIKTGKAIQHNTSMDHEPPDNGSSESNSEEEFQCKYCLKKFLHKNHMYRHQKHYCKKDSNDNIINILEHQHNVIMEQNENMAQLLNAVSDIKSTVDHVINNTPKQIAMIDGEPIDISSLPDGRLHEGEKIEQINHINNTTINNYVQIVCVGQNDDFFKILSARMGTEKAREYILNCAKNNLDGDINLLKTVYFDGKKPSDYPIKFLDRSRNKVEFIDENKVKIMDPTGMELAKRLCSNLQNGYLVQVNIIIEDNLNHKGDGKFLDEFDIFNCQNHIYELSNKR